MLADTQAATIVFLLSFTADFCLVILETDPRHCVLLVVCKHRLLLEDHDQGG